MTRGHTAGQSERGVIQLVTVDLESHNSSVNVEHTSVYPDRGFGDAGLGGGPQTQQRDVAVFVTAARFEQLCHVPSCVRDVLEIYQNVCNTRPSAFNGQLLENRVERTFKA